LENVLSLDNPNSYGCALKSYQHGHKELTLQVSKGVGEPDLRVVFTQVEYFSGPTTWLGANFTTDSDDAVIRFVREFRRYAFFTDETVIPLALHLYRVIPQDEPNFEVQILAGNIVLKND
jgi:hypothetical protein